MLLLGFPGLACQADDPGASPLAELVGIARLPADVFVPGPVSGQWIDPAGNEELAALLPFSLGQPIQGFSAIIPDGHGRFLVLADNGYGSRDNSADFILTLYRIRPDFRTHGGGSGTIAIESAIRLRDPLGQAPFRLTAEADSLPRGDDQVPVDPSMHQYALLSGADFDPESLQRVADGSFWIGDEFGPWLLHFDVVGRLLEAPVPLPGVSGPDNPLDIAYPRLAARSGGFEGLALDPERNLLFPMLEKPLEDGSTFLNIYTFDPRDGRFLDRPAMHYPLDQGGRAAGAIQSLGGGSFLVVERDDNQGEAAMTKRIYRVTEGRVNEDGWLIKDLVVDLLNIHDPWGLGAAGEAIGAGSVSGRFSFPYLTIESLVILGPDTLGVVNDNNYPFGSGPGGKAGDGPEETLFIVLKVPGLR